MATRNVAASRSKPKGGERERRKQGKGKVEGENDRMWRYSRTPWTSDHPVARPLLTEDNATQKDEDEHPCLERDSNPRYQCPRPTPQTARSL
jgi:hypothetical protein